VRIRVSNLLPLLLVLFLAALTLWLRVAVETPAGGDSGHRRHDPDAIVDNFTVTRLDEQGRAQYSLDARQMIHFADDDSTELSAPRFVRHGDGPAVTITADRGTVSHAGDEAFLHGNVLVVRAATPAQSELRIRTNYLHVLAEKNIARTNEAVTITEGKSVLAGIGMEYDRQENRLELHSHVRGTFDRSRN